MRSATARAVAITISGLLTLSTLAVGVIAAATGLHAATVRTGSMRPAFAPGDAVLTRSVPASAVRPGMVVEVTPPGESVPFAHRVVSVSGDPAHPTIKTKGDANPLQDDWTVTLNTATVPRVVGVVPNLGWVASAPTKPQDRAVLMALLGMTTTLIGVRMIVLAATRQARGMSCAS